MDAPEAELAAGQVGPRVSDARLFGQGPERAYGFGQDGVRAVGARVVRDGVDDALELAFGELGEA